jgi:hypothetical protein
MSSFDLSTVRFVREALSTTDANRLLSEGWVLISLFGDTRLGVMHYSFGWTDPNHMPPS